MKLPSCALLRVVLGRPEGVHRVAAALLLEVLLVRRVRVPGVHAAVPGVHDQKRKKLKRSNTPLKPRSHSAIAKTLKNATGRGPAGDPAVHAAYTCAPASPTRITSFHTATDTPKGSGAWSSDLGARRTRLALRRILAQAWSLWVACPLGSPVCRAAPRVLRARLSSLCTTAVLAFPHSCMLQSFNNVTCLAKSVTFPVESFSGFPAHPRTSRARRAAGRRRRTPRSRAGRPPRGCPRSARRGNLPRAGERPCDPLCLCVRPRVFRSQAAGIRTVLRLEREDRANSDAVGRVNEAVHE